MTTNILAPMLGKVMASVTEDGSELIFTDTDGNY